MNKELLQPDQIQFLHAGSIDDVGRVFAWNGRIFRAIHPAQVEATRRLLASGLIDHLVKKGLFPRTTEAAYQLPEFELILEHERVPVVTYPYEWSFEMLKAAALAVLEVNKIAATYGYQTKDSHAYNVLFEGNRPKFIDLGSFVSYPEGGTIWEGYAEFLSQYVYPLTVWRDGNEFLARRILAGATNPFMPVDSFWLYRHPILRKLPQKRVKQLARASILQCYFRGRSTAELKRKIPGKRGEKLAALRKIVPTYRINFDRLRQRVQKLQLSTQATMWENYHISSGLLSAAGRIQPSARFQRIAAIIAELGVESVTELAGNQGVFARYLLECGQVKQVVCTDYESSAVDTLYKALADGEAISPAVLNFVRPLVMSSTSAPDQRLRSEAVVALAVTHHLLLTQHEQIDHILQSILPYASRYILLEFMPLGLFDGKHAPPTPDWYDLEWFRAACERHFDVLEAEQLEENRIIFVGKLRSPIPF